MRTDKAALLLSMALLAGCVSTGPLYNEANLPKSEGATVIVYRPNAFVGVVGSYDVKIDGKYACDIHNAAFFASGGHSGRVTISSTRIAAIGTSRLTIDAKPGETYYVRMENNDAKSSAAIGAGFVGQMVAEGMSETSGPFIFSLIAPAQAKQELQNLKQDCI